ncbi:MAG: hypothetical protein WDO70_10855 [Alphaproteobacteria bacterium]
MELSYREILGGLSAAIIVAANIPYFVGIFQRRFEPHVFSWLVWGINAGVVCAGQYVSGGGPGSWTSGFYAVIGILIALLGLKYGEKHITRGDWITLAVAFAAMPLWWITKDPLWSVILVTLIDVVIFYPTLRKSWNRPFHESLLMCAPAAVSNLLSLGALEVLNLTTVFSPMIMAVANGACAWAILHRRRIVARA